MPDWDELTLRIMKDPDDVFPKLFPVVAEAANAEDSAAKEIMFASAIGLASLAMVVIRRLGMKDQAFPLVKCGGVFWPLHHAGRAAGLRAVQWSHARQDFAPGNSSGGGRRSRPRGSRKLRRNKPRPMAPEETIEAQAARTAPSESILALLDSHSEDVLRALIDNPALDETHLCLLLERKDLSGLLLEEISKRKTWRGSYRVRLGLAAHPHTPRLIAMRLLRELHLMDLVRISLLPASSMELRRLAEERVLAQLPQIPLGLEADPGAPRFRPHRRGPRRARAGARGARGARQLVSDRSAAAQGVDQGGGSGADLGSCGRARQMVQAGEHSSGLAAPPQRAGRVGRGARGGVAAARDGRFGRALRVAGIRPRGAARGALSQVQKVIGDLRGRAEGAEDARPGQRPGRGSRCAVPSWPRSKSPVNGMGPPQDSRSCRVRAGGIP